MRDKNKRKGLIGTVLFHALLFVFLIFMGLTYQEPKPEEGIVINFGYSEQSNKKKESVVLPPLKTERTKKTSPPTDEKTESILTQEVEETVNIKKEEKPFEKTKEESIEQREKEIIEEQVEKTLDEDLLKAEEIFKFNKSQPSGDGATNENGDQGVKDGDISKNQKKGGRGDLAIEGMGDRQALYTPKYIPDCNETGIVVVDIRVNKLGHVTSAETSLKSTNTASCLTTKAKKAALETRFEKANISNQAGRIIYVYSIQ